MCFFQRDYSIFSSAYQGKIAKSNFAPNKQKNKQKKTQLQVRFAFASNIQNKQTQALKPGIL